MNARTHSLRLTAQPTRRFASMLTAPSSTSTQTKNQNFVQSCGACTSAFAPAVTALTYPLAIRQRVRIDADQSLPARGLSKLRTDNSAPRSHLLNRQSAAVTWPAPRQGPSLAREGCLPRRRAHPRRAHDEPPIQR